MVSKIQSAQQQQPEPDQEEYSIANEKISLELLMADWYAEQAQVARAVEYNRQAGVKNPEAYVGYGFATGTTEPVDIKRKTRWWNAITNKRTGKPNTLEALQNAGIVSDDEIALFGDTVFPKRELSQLHRIRKNDGTEWLVRMERWSGLNSVGGVFSIPVNLGFHRRVPISQSTTQNEQGNDVKILTVGTTENAYYYLPKIYTTKFTKQNVLDSLKVAPPIMENGVLVKVSYVLSLEGVTRTIGAPDLETFTDADFMEYWEQSSIQQPTISIDPKTFSNYVRMDLESKTNHKQYS